MNEAHLLFFRTSKWAALATKRRKIVIATLCVGWGIPVILTSITAAVGFSRESFMDLSEFVGLDGPVSDVSTKGGPLYENCLAPKMECVLLLLFLLRSFSLIILWWRFGLWHLFTVKDWTVKNICHQIKKEMIVVVNYITETYCIH